MNETQANLLLEKAKQYVHEWYEIWAAALYTGMRNEELYALRWINVDFENRLIFVREVWTKKGGFKAITKNGHDRAVEIAVPLLAILKELKLKKTPLLHLFFLESKNGQMADRRKACECS